MSPEEDDATTINITQPRKGQEKRSSCQIRYGSRPCLGRITQVQRSGDGRQDDVETGGEKLTHHHGHDDGEDEAALDEPIGEEYWSLAAEALKVCLEEVFVGILVGGGGLSSERVMGRWFGFSHEEAMDKKGYKRNVV